MDYSYEGMISNQKMIKLSAIITALICMIILILDISNKLITYFDDDLRFEINFNDLKRIRSLKSIKNDTIDQKKLKNLFNEGIKNCTDEQNYNNNLSYLTGNLTKYKYKGKWRTKQSFGEFDQKEGVLKLYISSK